MWEFIYEATLVSLGGALLVPLMILTFVPEARQQLGAAARKFRQKPPPNSPSQANEQTQT